LARKLSPLPASRGEDKEEKSTDLPSRIGRRISLPRRTAESSRALAATFPEMACSSSSSITSRTCTNEPIRSPLVFEVGSFSVICLIEMSVRDFSHRKPCLRVSLIGGARDRPGSRSPGASAPAPRAATSKQRNAPRPCTPAIGRPRSTHSVAPPMIAFCGAAATSGQ